MKYLYCDLKRDIRANITIFAIPKPFEGHIGIIQENAIISWTLLNPRPEIILFGDELGTKEISQKLGLIHFSSVKRNQYGTPLLDGIFAQAHRQASHEVLAYVNADLILFDDFLLTVASVTEQLKDFLIIGRRWNLEIERHLEFKSDWQERLKQKVEIKGCLAPQNCKDYFVFPKNLGQNIPSFAVGRGYWDTWMVNQSLARGYPVVDASLTNTVVHQDHDYAHLRGGKNEAYMGKEAQINKALEQCEGKGNIADATWLIKSSTTQNLPKISVVVVTTEGATKIDKTVLSILAQNYPQCEIIAINNSNNLDLNTRTLLHPYRQYIRYVNRFGDGIIEAYNYGLNIARGELILFLTSGDFLLTDTLSQQIACFENEASTVDILLSGRQISKASSQKEQVPWEILPDLDNIHIWQLNKIWKPLSNNVVIWRRKRLQQINGFNFQLNNQFSFLEAILCLTMLRGSRAVWFPKIVCNYERPNSIDLTPPSDRHFRQTIDSIFQRPEIKEWMLLLQPLAYRAIES
ncbi:MAG: glycosyltransferase [Pleurocapsa sp.]